MVGTEKGSVAAFWKSVDPRIRPVAVALRRLVRSAAPDLEERIKYSSPHFDLKGTRGTVVYLATHADHVNLGFYEGALLEDLQGLLEGTGKGLRHVKVHSVAEAKNPALEALVREAVRFRRPTGAPPKRSR